MGQKSAAAPTIDALARSNRLSGPLSSYVIGPVYVADSLGTRGKPIRGIYASRQQSHISTEECR
jgi:hypothetical protein